MSNGPDMESGSKKESVKRKLLLTTTENLGPAFKKFVPVVPPRLPKPSNVSQLVAARKIAQEYKEIPGAGGTSKINTTEGANQEYQPRSDNTMPPAPHEQAKVSRAHDIPSTSHEQVNFPQTCDRPSVSGEQPEFPRLDIRPPPLGKPNLIQTEGTLFGQGVGVTSGKGRKRGPKSTQSCTAFDPVMIALSAVDQYEDFPSNFCPKVSLNQPAGKANVSDHHNQVDNLVLKRDSLIKDEDLVTVNQKMFQKLKYHQIEGIKFMWDAVFKNDSKAGCVLAHCMGLGKSLQLVTLAHTVLINSPCRVTRVLVVCPLSTVFNWENEFRIWLPDNTFSTLNVSEMASCKNSKAKEEKMKRWLNFGGVMIIGYEMFRTLTKEKKKPSEQDLLFTRCLVDPGPDLLICDEGHLLKNEDSEIYKCMNKIRTRRRIMLTGTPLQNNMFEFFTMVQFVHPGLLGTKAEFGKNFEKVLKKGQAVDSTQSDVLAMKRRALILHKMLENTVQRFDSNVLAPFLPPKHEYVVSVKMSELQIRLYEYYLKNYTKGGAIQPLDTRVESAGLFSDYQQLSRVCSHPRALMLASSHHSNKPSGGSKKGKNSKNDEEDISWAKETDEIDDVCEKDSTSRLPWWSNIAQDSELSSIVHSGKMILLIKILRHCESVGDKLLVFSQSLTTLGLIEEFLAKEDSENQSRKSVNTNEMFSGTWGIDKDYFRLDGSTSSEMRLKWCKDFNDPENPRARLFLISTKAGGIGINLTGANRAVIFDASWNPSQDLQSVFRIYRLGQKKPCYVYRFFAQGTMEEKVYYRQVAKLSLSRRIVDEEEMDRCFASNDLSDLYTFNPDGQLFLPESIGDANSLDPQDQLLVELAVNTKEWIGSYREHDSLLQSRPEEYMENSEREAIWKIFEETKKRSQDSQEVKK